MSVRPLPLRARIRLHVLIQLLLVAWIVWVANAWAFRNSWRLDWTADARYELAPETREFLRQLPKRVDIIVPTSMGRSAEDRIRARVFDRAIRTLREFELVNPYCRVAEVLDIGRDPVRWGRLREEHGIDAPNRVYLFAGDRREWVGFEDLAEIAPTIDGPTLARERVPEALSAALERLVREEAPRVLFTRGHGEASPSDERAQVGLGALVRDLTERGIVLESSDLRRGGSIPEGVDVVVIAAGSTGPDPFEPLGLEARGEVERFLAAGGDLLVLLPFDGESGLESILEPLGIGTRSGLVHTGSTAGGGGIGALEVDLFDEEHPVTRRLRSEVDTVELASFRALTVAPPARALVTSPAEAWLERDLAGVHDPEEPLGPFPLVAASEGEEGSGRVLVFASWTPVIDALHRGQSRRLLLAGFDWLTERDGPVAGAGRVDPRERVLLDPAARRLWLLLTLVAYPGAIILIGVGVWSRRRAH